MVKKRCMVMVSLHTKVQGSKHSEEIFIDIDSNFIMESQLTIKKIENVVFVIGIRGSGEWVLLDR